MDRGTIIPAFVTRLAVAVAGLLTVAVLLLTIFNDKGILKVREQNKQLEQLNKDLDNISTENKQLGQDINDLYSNPTVIERRAREQLRLVRPNEVILITPESEAAPEKPSTGDTKH